jgi:beta-galactosidase/beta-glucuronidase
MSIPRAEYPRPQFARPEWLCLNGPWQFEIDHGDSGLERGLLQRELQGAITVPFCPESALSGIGNTDFLNAVWYRREVDIPPEWAGKHVLLHFQAVDYDTTVWVNGVEVGRHRGGWTGFTCNLDGVAGPGETATIVVRARDFTRQPMPRGKQSDHYNNVGCIYTRTTGIWQTVWMEPVPEVALKRPRITPDVANGQLYVQQPLTENRAGHTVRMTLRSGERVICTRTTPADAEFCPQITLPIPLRQLHLWGPGEPNLYDLDIDLLDSSGAVVDRASSYAGMRSITIEGKTVKINGKPVFQRLVLDQGFYPDGVLTAPTDDDLKSDIVLSMNAGFNGARLHQKVFEERFLYHADRLGYLCWGEFGDWGIDRAQPSASYVGQWLEELHRDYSHPSIVGWCPLNETGESITDRVAGLEDVTNAMYLAAKAMDQTRPVLDASGYSHRIRDVDIWDCHDYEQRPEVLASNQAGLSDGKPFQNGPADRPWNIPYHGQPFFVSEFGGTWWNPKVGPDDPSWGYGERPRTIEEFYERFNRLCGALLDNPDMFGYCYTQLTDVFQEQNGIYFFDRSSKFDIARIRTSQQRRAAIEKQR